MRQCTRLNDNLPVAWHPAAQVPHRLGAHGLLFGIALWRVLQRGDDHLHTARVINRLLVGQHTLGYALQGPHRLVSALCGWVGFGQRYQQGGGTGLADGRLCLVNL